MIPNEEYEKLSDEERIAILIDNANNIARRLGLPLLSESEKQAIRASYYTLGRTGAQ